MDRADGRVKRAHENMSRLAAIIPAAGFSSRMGRFKPLLALGESRVVDRCVRVFTESGIDDILVVCGHRGREVADAATGLGACPVFNPHFEDGMFSSVKTGVKALGRVDAFFVLPVDIPLVRPATVRALIESFECHPASVTYPVFLQKKGHPPLISSDLRNEIVDHDGSGGLRTVLNRHAGNSFSADVSDRGILFDLDHPADYESAKSEVLRRYPDRDECHAIWELENVSPAVRKHCRAVACLARHMALVLNRSRSQKADLSPELTEAAALVHDVAKGRKNHAQAGAAVLRKYGFDRVADIVAAHPDLEIEAGQIITEKEIVFLADKFVQGDQPVPLVKRYRDKMKKFGKNPEVEKKISGRLERALKVSRLFEDRAQINLEVVACGCLKK